MANHDNTTDHLKVGDRKFPEWDEIFEMQHTLQKRLGYNFSNMTLGHIAKFFLLNKHALEDEMGETLDALGGIRDGIGSAVWKNWKSNNAKAYNITIKDLSDHDRQELLMEIVDMLHFFINFPIACGFTGSEVANAYMAKNAENHVRQDNNY